MAPEIFEKNYNEKCDVWALGLIILESLTGKRLYNGKNNTEIH